MDSAPAYLLLYFLKIRKHSGEVGYLVARAKKSGYAMALDEESMARDLNDLHLIALSNEKEELRFGSETVLVHKTFWLLSRGRWYWTELIARSAAWAITASVGAVLGTLCTLWLAG